MNDLIYIGNVKFKRTTVKNVKKDILPNMLFFMISQSGALDRCGTIYFFTDTDAFFMEREDYPEDFKHELAALVPDWNWVNAYFCDFLVFRPDIYNSFVHELCSHNQPFFWFDTAIDVYKNKYCKKQ